MSHRIRVLFAAGLLCFSGLVLALPGAVNDRAEADVWGDPEDDEGESRRAWTWFGMGYENRAQTSVRPADAGSEGASGTGSGKGNSVGNGSGRIKGGGKGRN